MPETQTASVRLPKLNAALFSCIRRCHASTRLSSASVTAPASGPKRSTAVNAKTSETVNRASRPGITRVMPAADEGQRGEEPPLHRQSLTGDAGDAIREEAQASGRYRSGVGAQRRQDARDLAAGSDITVLSSDGIDVRAPHDIVLVGGRAPDDVLARRILHRRAPDHVVAAKSSSQRCPRRRSSPACSRAGSTDRAG